MLRIFWRYGQLFVNFDTLKMDLAAILDHVTLYYVKGHQFYLHNLKALTVFLSLCKVWLNILDGYKDVCTSVK